MRKHVFFLALMCASIITLCGSVSAADITSMNNSTYNTHQFNVTGAQNNNTKWTYTTGGSVGYSSPIIGSDGTIYVGSSDKNIYAINPNGTTKWTYTTGGIIKGSVAIAPDNTIYIGSGDKNIYAINPNGTLKWTYTTENSIYGSPAIGADGTIYIGSTDNNVYAINPDGTLKWTFTTGGYVSYGSPAIGADGTIYIGSYDKNIYAINPNGTLKWTYTTGSSIYGSPAIGADGTIYIGSTDKNLYALNPNGTLEWTYTTGGTLYGSPAIGADGTIYIGSTDNNVYAINPDGTLKWTYATGNSVYGSPAIGADGTIYIGSTDYNIYALNYNGTLKWIYKTGNSLYYSIPSIDSDGTLYIGSSDNNIYAISAVDFDANQTIFNESPGTVNFTNKSPDSPISWLWNFGDGTTSIEQNPTHTYTDSGLYNVTLTTSYSNNASSYVVKSNYIIVYGPPVSGFNVNTTSGQEPFNVQFNDTSTGYNITSWFWNFGDGTNSTEQNPSHTYTTVGNYSVSLTVTNAGGNNTLIQPNIVSVQLTAPIANFSLDNTWGVNNVTVNFTDESTYNPTSWLWDFGDGTTSNQQNPTHTYTNVGTYSVTLTTTNSAGMNNFTKLDCVIVRNSTPTVIPASNGVNLYVSNHEGVKYDINGTSPYVPNTYYIGMAGGLNPLSIDQQTTTSDQSGSFNIDFNGGQPTMPDAILMLAVNGTIPDDFAVTITSSGYNWILPAPSYDNSYSSDNLTYVVDALNETFYKSDFIYGPQIWRPCSAADYPIFNGQNMSDTNNTFDIMFIDLGVGDCGGPTTVTYNFTDLQSFAAFDVYGWYTASSHGTGIIMTNSVNSGYNVVATPPIANFTATTTSDLSAPVHFIDNSYVPDSWYWDFGDGTKSTQQNPSHTYTAPGTYTVTLTVTNAFGNNTVTQNITKIIPSSPVANFTSNIISGISPLNVQFYDNSTNNPLTWYWDFGDGTNSTLQNPTHSYTTPGNYNVSLTVTNGGGSNNLTETNYITVYYPPPVASFTANPTTGIAPDTINLTDTSTGNITSYYWDFGDGTNSTLQDPSHVYSPGTYTVSETVTGPGGTNTSTLTNYIYVKYPAPVAKFSSNTTSGSLPLNVQFNDNSIGNVNDYSWTFGDGTNSTLQNPTHTYTKTGSFTVTETVTGPGGSNSQSEMGYITVNYASPVANFTANTTNGTAPLNIQFKDNSIGNITSYNWNFGDNTPNSTLQNPTHTYTVPGTYNVTETVNGPGGSNNLIENNYITVLAPDTTPPVVNSSLTSGYYNSTQIVTLTATDNMDPNPKIYYTLNGTTPTINSKLYTGPITFSNIGITTFKFIALDDSGNISNTTTDTYVIDKTSPTASVNIAGGLYNVTKTITITMSETGNIYYTLNGTTPTTNSTKYTKPLTISATTVLKYLAVDLAGNKSSVYSQIYTIDKIPPKVLSTNPKNLAQGISKTATITIKFSENIKTSTYWSKIYVKDLTTGKIITINKIISGSTLTIKTVTKSAYHWYQIYIPAAAVKDNAGNNNTITTFKYKTN